jgi:hypothetical protein
MKRKKPVPVNEKKLRRKLSEMTGQVRAFLAMLDELMMQPSTVERGRKIAKLCNELALYNDGVRYFWCGVDYRSDTVVKARGKSLQAVVAVDRVVRVVEG